MFLHNTVAEDVYGFSDGSAPTSVTADSSANSKGSWTELASAIDADRYCVGLKLFCFATSATTQTFLIDIGVGGSGSEVVIVSNLIASFTNNTSGGLGPGNFYTLPLLISPGTRISARVQSSVASGAASIFIVAMYGDSKAPVSRLIRTYGADTSDSGGTQIDPGASASNWGSWVEITAATEFPISGIIAGIGNQDNTARSSYWFDLAIGVGSAGSEEMLVSQLTGSYSISDLFTNPVTHPFPVAVPKGSRLACRAMCNGTDATDRLFDVVLYCIS